jgi:hypothetical protein
VGTATRAKLVAFALGTLAIAFPLLVLEAVPTPQPPAMVERIDLQAPRGGKQRADGKAHVPTAGRQRQRSGRGDRRPGTARRAQEWSGRPPSRAVSTGEAGAQAQRTPPDRAAAESPTVLPRSESEPPAGRRPSPRGTPVSGTPPATRNSPPEGDPPPDPSDPSDEAASTAAVDPPEEPEPADGEPPEESEPTDGEPPM